MMDPRYDLIESIELHKLEKRSDRRGAIVTFTVKEIPNHEMALETTVQMIQFVISFLANHYRHVLQEDRLGKFGEQGDCWIDDDLYNPRHVVVRHKYWDEERIKAFKIIVKTLAKLHGWKTLTTKKEAEA